MEKSDDDSMNPRTPGNLFNSIAAPGSDSIHKDDKAPAGGDGEIVFGELRNSQGGKALY